MHMAGRPNEVIEPSATTSILTTPQTTQRTSTLHRAPRILVPIRQLSRSERAFVSFATYPGRSPDRIPCSHFMLGSLAGSRRYRPFWRVAILQYIPLRHGNNPHHSHINNFESKRRPNTGMAVRYALPNPGRAADDPHDDVDAHAPMDYFTPSGNRSSCCQTNGSRSRLYFWSQTAAFDFGTVGVT